MEKNKPKEIEFKCTKCKYLLYQTYQLTNMGVEVFTPKCTKCEHQMQAEDVLNSLKEPKEEEWYEQQGMTEAEYYEREMLLEKERNPNREMSIGEQKRLRELTHKML